MTLDPFSIAGQSDWTNIRERISTLDDEEVAEFALALADLDYRLSYDA